MSHFLAIVAVSWCLLTACSKLLVVEKPYHRVVEDVLASPEYAIIPFAPSSHRRLPEVDFNSLQCIQPRNSLRSFTIRNMADQVLFLNAYALHQVRVGLASLYARRHPSVAQDEADLFLLVIVDRITLKTCTFLDRIQLILLHFTF